MVEICDKFEFYYILQFYSTLHEEFHRYVDYER